MPRLKHKVALISGASRGIGAATARRFVAEGGQVVLCDVLVEEGEQLAAELGQDSCFYQLDVADERQWSSAVKHALARFGRLDILVNNAGISGGGSPLELESAESYRRLVQVNQDGVYLGMRAVLPAMRQVGGGAIVNVSSIAGLVAFPGLGAYSATKFAVVGLTKSAAVEFSRDHVRVNCVHPGVTATAIIESVDDATKAPLDAAIARTPMARLGRPEEIAAAILFFASEDSSFCTGASLAVDGGWTTI